MDYKKIRRGHIIYMVFLMLSILILSLLGFSLAWVTNHYGNIGFDEIVFHLRMPLQGTSIQFIQSYLDTALKPALYTAIELSGGILLICYTFLSFPKTKVVWLINARNLRQCGVLVITVCTVIILGCAQVQIGFFDYILV